MSKVGAFYHRQQRELLHLAATDRSGHELREMLDGGCEVCDDSDPDFQPVLAAAEAGNSVGLNILLRNGAPASPGTPISPLKAAALKGHVDCCVALLEHGAYGVRSLLDEMLEDKDLRDSRQTIIGLLETHLRTRFPNVAIASRVRPDASSPNTESKRNLDTQSAPFKGSSGEAPAEVVSVLYEIAGTPGDALSRALRDRIVALKGRIVGYEPIGRGNEPEWSRYIKRISVTGEEVCGSTLRVGAAKLLSSLGFSLAPAPHSPSLADEMMDVLTRLQRGEKFDKVCAESGIFDALKRTIDQESIARSSPTSLRVGPPTGEAGSTVAITAPRRIRP